MEKVFVTTIKAGTRHRMYVHGTDRPQTIRGGITMAAVPPQEVRFNRGVFVASDAVRYKLYDSIDGDTVVTQIEWMDRHPENVANGGQAFRQHQPWMDKVDAARLLQESAASMSDAKFLEALHKIESMPEGPRPTAADVQVHVGARDAAAKGVRLEEVEPNYGNLEAILKEASPASPELTAALKKAMTQQSGL